MLDQEKCALHVHIELAVVECLVDLRDGREPGDARIDERDVDAVMLGLY